MKSIAVVLGGILVLALFAREFNWRTRALVLVGLVVMVVVLMR